MKLSAAMKYALRMLKRPTYHQPTPLTWQDAEHRYYILFTTIKSLEKRGLVKIVLPAHVQVPAKYADVFWELHLTEQGDKEATRALAEYREARSKLTEKDKT